MSESELFQNLGFTNNPFSTFSAEEEKTFLNHIYLNPLFFQTLKSDLKSGHSRFILGARGIGKTALLLQLKEVLEEEKVFSLIVDEFDGIPVKNNETELTELIIRRVVTKFCLEIRNDRKKISKLDKDSKEKLSFIIKEFFQTLSTKEYERNYNRVNGYKKRNIFRGIWNYLFNKPVNFAISGCVEIIGDTVRKSFGLPTSDNKDFFKNYLPELTFEEINKEKHPEKLLSNYKSLKSILNDLTQIIQKTGYKTTVVFFDKIDEYTKLNSNISAVADFLESFLKDTTILMNKNYALVFSIWDALRPELTNSGVRFDKIKPIDISWNFDNIEDIIDKRIRFFSEDKKSFGDILDSKASISEIINLSNNSPRYLFRQLSYIYDQQSELNPDSKKFTKEAIERDQLTYAQNFDYYTIYPTKRGSKDDILTNINRILKIGKEVIMTKDYVEIFKVSTPTAISYIKIAQDYNLVREQTETISNAKTYVVGDPVIKHLIKNNITEIQK